MAKKPQQMRFFPLVLCLMANDDKDDDRDQNHKEVLEFLNSCSKDELA